MKVVSVVAQKGGTGKTTLSLATPCAAAADGIRMRRSSSPPRLARLLAAAAGPGVDLAVVDTAPRVALSAIAAAQAADLIVIPCRPAVYDLDTVVSTLDVVRAVAPGTPVLCVLNGVPPRGPRQAHAREILAEVGIRVCPASLGLRAAIDYAAAVGLSPQEHEPRSKAAAEMADLYNFVRELVELPSGG